jgi:hypothetical protein
MRESCKEKQHAVNEVKERWLCGINERLTTKTIAMRIQRNNGFTTLVVNWEQALETERGLPSNCINLCEVLVGRTAQHTHEPGNIAF